MDLPANLIRVPSSLTSSVDIARYANVVDGVLAIPGADGARRLIGQLLYGGMLVGGAPFPTPEISQALRQALLVLEAEIQ